MRSLLRATLAPSLSLLVSCSAAAEADVSNDTAPVADTTSAADTETTVDSDASTDVAQPGDVTPTLVVEPLPTEAPAGEVLDVHVTVTPTTSVLEVAVVRGGGSVTAGEIVPDAGGRATISWRLGVMPIPQRVRVHVRGELPAIELDVDATRSQPLTSAPFADVAGFLAADPDAVASDSTEDLVFARGGIVLGAPKGLISVAPNGSVSRLPLTGDVPARAWGVASHPDGALWFVDSAAQRLSRVDEAGVVKAVLTGDGDLPFDGLNDVEVGPDKRIYASDPCLGRIVRVNAAGDTQDGSLVFDRATQGGPNGMAFDDQGRLYASTENTVVLCGQDVADYDAPLAGIYRAVPTETGFGPLEPIAEKLGVFGDGLTFDSEGNLYGIMDTLAGVAIGESAVWVLPGGEGPARKVVAAAPGVLYANVAFGQGAFGDRTLYLCLLNAAPLTGPDSIGLERLDVGVTGRPSGMK